MGINKVKELISRVFRKAAEWMNNDIRKTAGNLFFSYVLSKNHFSKLFSLLPFLIRAICVETI